MNVAYRVLYLSSKSTANKSQAWWDAWKFAIAVKEGTVKGYFHVPLGFGLHKKITKSNVKYARVMHGRWLLRAIAARVAGQSVALVPIPSSGAAVGLPGPFRHATLLHDCLNPHAQGDKVADILRFTEVMKKASQGGPRFERDIYPKLVVDGDVPDKPIVLVDDILTSGGHMKACRRKLEEAGGRVVLGIVCGRTVDQTDEDPWKEGEEPLTGGYFF